MKTIGNFNGSFVLELNVKLSQAAINNGGRITTNPAFPGWYRVTYPVGLDELPDDFFPLPFPTNVQGKDYPRGDLVYAAQRAEINALAESGVNSALAMIEQQKKK